MTLSLKVLSPGFAQWLHPDRVMRASGSCTLIRSPDQTVLVDTLGPWETSRLKDLLDAQGLHPDDVNVVVCTHGHPDHVGNLNLFTRSRVHVVGFSVYEEDRYSMHPFDQDKPFIVGPGIEVIPTPGHTLTCVSVVAKDVDRLGTVVIAGDLFERQQDLQDEHIWINAGSENPTAQRLNRQKVLDMADYIVPGHGDMFKVVKEN